MAFTNQKKVEVLRHSHSELIPESVVDECLHCNPCVNVSFFFLFFSGLPQRFGAFASLVLPKTTNLFFPFNKNRSRTRTTIRCFIKDEARQHVSGDDDMRCCTFVKVLKDLCLLLKEVRFPPKFLVWYVGLVCLCY